MPPKKTKVIKKITKKKQSTDVIEPEQDTVVEVVSEQVDETEEEPSHELESDDLVPESEVITTDESNLISLEQVDTTVKELNKSFSIIKNSFAEINTILEKGAELSNNLHVSEFRKVIHDYLVEELTNINKDLVKTGVKQMSYPNIVRKLETMLENSEKQASISSQPMINKIMRENLYLLNAVILSLIR